MKQKSLILAVDRNRRNLELLAEFLGKEGYRVLAAASMEEFDQAISESKDVGLVLLDIAGFERGIWDRCEQLREQGIPFLVLSPRQSVAIHQESLAHGAAGVLVKPLLIRQLLGVIQSLLER
ncbi:MAG: response regulator transcription factor [Chloroflexota bacterium]|nr:MAG: response regulator transcription factor [Chloroflexota bacterium]